MKVGETAQAIELRQIRRKNRVGDVPGSCQSERVNDYERIARVIQYLDTHHTEQPDLTTLAGRVGLSAFHFHRLFSSWAGVTPKDFLQCLTMSHAKALLRRGESVLNSALESGLSGPGRLHDLSITLEAATPGELKSGGEGCEIRYGYAQTPFGLALVAQTARGICHLSFHDATESAGALAELETEWSEATRTRDDSEAARLSAFLFADSKLEEDRGSLRAFVRGTPFQVRVWRALLRIPPGVLVSYGRLAEAVGTPRAARAVGTAVGRNPVAFLIPCHRVIRETGIIGNYRWGPVRKRAILAWELAGAKPVCE